ncbi:MAG TPA: protein kinase [Actinomycetota bacterium]|nr:protein kinase [Actinomycetota bacterium]
MTDIDFLTQVEAAIAASDTAWRVGVVQHDGRQGSWHAQPPPIADRRWIQAEPSGAVVPDRGWKLHVSATPWSAPDVLSRVLPLLIERRAAFKIAASPAVVTSLNEGEGGLTQIGKFVTVYPATEAAAIELASALHLATDGLRGPAVPSDQPLRRGSLVHYRFGAFDPAVDEAAAPLEPIEGKTVAINDDTSDRPDSDPFLAAGVAERPTEGLIADRYLVTSTIYDSPRGAVHVASDLERLLPCILKRAPRDARVLPDGSDARDQLRHEARVLMEISDPRVPAVYELIDHDDDLLLSMELIEGEKLSRFVARYVGAGRPLPTTTILRWAKEVAEFVGRLHSSNLVYRDVSSANVMVTPALGLRFIDFELANPVGRGETYYPAGTPGYCSPGQAAGRAAAFTDDLYGIGALLYFLVLREEPPETTDLAEHLDRPDLPQEVAEIIRRCVTTGGDRYPSVDELAKALVRWGDALIDV